MIEPIAIYLFEINNGREIISNGFLITLITIFAVACIVFSVVIAYNINSNFLMVFGPVSSVLIPLAIVASQGFLLTECRSVTEHVYDQKILITMCRSLKDRNFFEEEYGDWRVTSVDIKR